MTYAVLQFLHLLGLTLMGAGLIGVWYPDPRSRQARELPVLEFIEGNTITRLYFMLTHFPGIPILFVIVALGAMRPNTSPGLR